MTDTNPICEGLLKRGVLVRPVRQDGVDLKLTWDTNLTGPILEGRVAVVLPDIHLSDDADGDIFRRDDPGRHAWLLNFLTALSQVRKELLQAGRPVVALHLGDFYDVWRAYPEYKDHPTSDYDRIERPYGDVIDLLINELDLRVCVGNHDATLGRFPPWWARTQNGPNGRLAFSQCFAGNKVMAFHGHQVDQVENAERTQGSPGAVKAATLAAQKLSNPLSLLLQEGIDLALDAFADSHLLGVLPDALWPKSSTLKDAGGFSASVWSDRYSMNLVQGVLERLTFKDALRLVFVGHSHRAGISSLTLEERVIPVVDCGSWVWGRAQFGVAVEGEVSLWTHEPG